ncbi:MAG: GIY-YIG nuclease family protein [Gammaproteobacteria bacterium]
MKKLDQNKVRDSLRVASKDAKKWFLDKSISSPRSDWKKVSCIAKNIRNIVYAFFDEAGSCIYVGVSKVELKKRIHYKTSPHAKKPWWRKWKTVNVLEISNASDRLFLEMLLIISLMPSENMKPAGRNIKDVFKS